MVFLAKSKGSHIHYFKIFVYSLSKSKVSILSSFRIFLWISSIDTIYTGTLEDYISIDFYGTKHSR